ncbi:putative disease resistance protein RGA4 [Prosopis cineraria]|nr:putative disease resistance protein RGA4 [Prosopis cineraria]
MRIDICDFSNLKLLDGKGLRCITSLEELYISDCPQLESLPEDELPSSLLELNISGCPKLLKRYDFQRGRHLSKIAHIPTVQIHGKYYDPWEASQECTRLSMDEGEGSSITLELPNRRDLLEAKSKLKEMKGDQDDLRLFW